MIFNSLHSGLFWNFVCRPYNNKELHFYDTVCVIVRPYFSLLKGYPFLRYLAPFSKIIKHLHLPVWCINTVLLHIFLDLSTDINIFFDLDIFFQTDCSLFGKLFFTFRNSNLFIKFNISFSKATSSGYFSLEGVSLSLLRKRNLVLIHSSVVRCECTKWSVFRWAGIFKNRRKITERHETCTYD